MKPMLECVYGRSGSGKTTWGLKLASYIYEQTGLTTYWYLGDGGYETILQSGLIDAKIITVFPYVQHKFPLETSQRICEGYRPQDPLDPGSKLLPPTTEQLAKTGLYVYEGLTVIGDYIMGDTEGGLADRMAKGEILNNDASFRVKDGGMQFGGNARSHYGFAQRRIPELIRTSGRLPNFKLWTAHERRVEDDEYGKEILIGPEAAGQKLTTKLGASFGNMLHLHPAHVKVRKEDPLTRKTTDITQFQYRVYLQEHYDPDTVTKTKFLANARISDRVREHRPELIPEYMAPADPLSFYAKLDELSAIADTLPLSVHEQQKLRFLSEA